MGLLLYVLRKSFQWFSFYVASSGAAHIFLHFSTRIYSKGVLIHIAGEDKQSLLGLDKSLPTQNFTPTDFQHVRVITSIVEQSVCQERIELHFL